MKRLRCAFFLALGCVLSSLLSSCIGPCGVSWPGESSASDALPAAKYDAAEIVYRYFLPGGRWPEVRTNFVYRLSFADSHDEMSADFLARFAGAGYRVISGDAKLEFQPGLILEAKSKQPVVMLELQSLAIYQGQARAQMEYVTGSMHATETLQLSQQDGRWKVMQTKEKERTYQ